MSDRRTYVPQSGLTLWFTSVVLLIVSSFRRFFDRTLLALPTDAVRAFLLHLMTSGARLARDSAPRLMERSARH